MTGCSIRGLQHCETVSIHCVHICLLLCMSPGGSTLIGSHLGGPCILMMCNGASLRKRSVR